jgi:hypothetical protein
VVVNEAGVLDLGNPVLARRDLDTPHYAPADGCAAPLLPNPPRVTAGDAELGRTAPEAGRVRVPPIARSPIGSGAAPRV